MQLHTGRGQGLDRADDARQTASEPIERDHDIALTGVIETRSPTGSIVTAPERLPVKMRSERLMSQSELNYADRVLHTIVLNKTHSHHSFE